MRRLAWFLVMPLALVARPMAAQDDGADSLQAAQIRQQIETRFGQQIQATLGLSNEQAAKLRTTFQAYNPKRRALEQDERGIKRALQDQLRPGIAANSDSVNTLVNRLLDNKVTYARTFVDEDKEMAKYLTPVQRAQYQMLRERLMARIEQIRQQRQQRMQGGAGLAQP